MLEQRAELPQLRAGRLLARFGHPGAARQSELRPCVNFRDDDKVRERASARAASAWRQRETIIDWNSIEIGFDIAECWGG